MRFDLSERKKEEQGKKGAFSFVDRQVNDATSKSVCLEETTMATTMRRMVAHTHQQQLQQ